MMDYTMKKIERIITSENDLNDEELNELSREIGKTEIK